jgi:hypothetical protein
VTTSIQGRSRETVAIWELDDYRHLASLAQAEYGADADGSGLRARRCRHRRGAVKA